MSKSSNLLQEAIADANKVKEIAYENAKAAIEEAFQPKIQRMISTKLAEEDYEEEMPPEMEPELAPEEEAMMGEEYIDDGKNGTPDNPLKNDGDAQTGLDEEEIDEEFDKIIRELEGGIDSIQEKDDAYDEKAGNSKKNIGEMDMPVDGAESEEEGDDLDNLNLEALIKKLEEEEFGMEPEPAEAEDQPFDTMQAENARLKEENQQAFKALAEMKSTMNEVNLLNSKLMYSSKIIQSFDLTEVQQVKILETFDRANSVREVKLIYTTIGEHYRGKSRKSTKKAVTESASRTIRTVKGNRRAKSEQLMEGAERWQIIAGLKPLND
jgi:hypothetical protein